MTVHLIITTKGFLWIGIYSRSTAIHLLNNCYKLPRSAREARNLESFKTILTIKTFFIQGIISVIFVIFFYPLVF